MKPNKHGMPFATYWERLTRAYMTHWLLALLFVLNQLVTTLNNMRADADALKNEISGACTDLEQISSAFMSIPSTLAVSAN